MDGNGKHNGNGKDHGDEDEDNVVPMRTLADRDRERREKEREQAKFNPASFLPKGGADGPLINLPPATKYLLGLFIGVHIVVTFFFAPPERYEIWQTYGFVPGYYSGMVDAYGLTAFFGPFTYMFLHGTWFHLILNSVMLMAFGTGAERTMGPKKMLLLFYACCLLSALAHFIVDSESINPVIGASGGLSGLFAAMLVLLQKSGQIPSGKYGIWPLVGIWVVISALFGMTGSPDGSGSPVAWVAHIGGFIAGIVLMKPIMKLKI